MFQFRRFPTHTYLIQYTLIRYCRTGFPHSEISGSMLMCSSPKLFAACHVLHRLLMPRHPPCALSSLTCCGLELCRHTFRSFYEIVTLFSSFHNFFFLLSVALRFISSLVIIVQFSRCSFECTFVPSKLNNAGK